jgi:YegS/Rv2252/BmrU family lipid kinase
VHQQRPPAPRDLLLVHNPGAGSADEQTLDQLSARWREAGAQVEPYELGQHPGLSQRLAETGAHRLVVAGGDGTLHGVLSELHTADPSLLARLEIALVPLGTGNDLARTLGLPLEPLDAAEVALHGTPRPMDLLVSDDGIVVMNAAHVGVGALATQRGQAVKGLLGPLGYAVGAVLAGASATGWPLTVAVDGRCVATPDEPLLMAGLAVGRTIGGGTPLAPAAEPDDGLADLVLVGATGPVERVDYARRLRRGEHAERDDVTVLRGSQVRLDAGDAPLNVDGELLGEAGSRVWTVHRHAWTALEPAAASSSALT